jgi:hypothetical protein
VDEEAGILHIPIERAMELTLERGLPVAQGAAETPESPVKEVSP